MSRSALDRLQDVVDSVDIAARHASGFNAAALAAAESARDATLFRIAVVCEAASQLPPEIKALAPEIPWRNIKGMRNYIVHGYWQIDLAVVVDTIASDLKPLKSAAKRLIETIQRSS